MSTLVDCVSTFEITLYSVICFSFSPELKFSDNMVLLSGICQTIVSLVQFQIMVLFPSSRPLGMLLISLADISLYCGLITATDIADL